jgi:hypothetical protein
MKKDNGKDICSFEPVMKEAIKLESRTLTQDGGDRETEKICQELHGILY